MKWYKAYFPFRVASAVTIPLIPVYVGMLGGSLVDAGLAVAIFNSAAALTSIVSGRFSNARILGSYILVGFFGVALSSVVFYTTSRVVHIFLASAIAGFATAICAIAAPLLIAETNKHSSWSKEISSFNRISDLGWLMGLIVGAFWSLLSKGRELFVTSAMLSIVSFAYAFAVLRQRPVELGGVKHVEAVTESSAQDKKLISLYMASTFLIFTSTALGYSLLPSFIVSIRGTSSEVFLAYVTSTIASILTYPKIERLSKGDDVRAQSWASAGRVLIMVAFTLLSLLVRNRSGILFVVVVMALSGFTWAILNVTGPTAAMKLAQGRRGRVMGVYNAAIFLSSIIGSFLSGIVAENLGYPVLFILAAALTLASIPLLEKISRTKLEKRVDPAVSRVLKTQLVTIK
ncbi:MAG: MFS transporter [Candidatus Jordarchaeales archaeon]